jgi:hypothetical protein
MSSTRQNAAALATIMDGPHLVKQIMLSCAMCIVSLVMVKSFLAVEARPDEVKPPRKSVCGRLRIPTRIFTHIERELLEQALLFPEDIVCVNPDELIGPALQQVLKQTRQLVKMSLREPASNRETVLSQSRGVLLFGPPGTGKTTVAKVYLYVCYEASKPFY